jgi:hypothetical protein
MKIQYSADGGKTWRPLPGARIPNSTIPGSLTTRFPAWVARFWQTGRRIDGKRARKTSLANSVPLPRADRYIGRLN